MSYRFLATLPIALLVAAGPALAQTAPAAPETTVGPSEQGFTFAPADGDHLKIDRRTGRVSVCGQRNGSWTCTLVPDDREALEDEVARLEADKRRLEARVADLERQASGAEPRTTEPWLGPEEERELERFMEFSGKAMRRFFGLVEELKREYEGTDRI
ncbi:hypothetical protein [Chthonobacter rhizosphaerae]|uniref:hypothetical protein n=1 Tax=Chthonobacter rhizosphaerae TaxID=2735553 RepID=UPI0015EE8BAE|nr:hypothetical protein [Chthonobacter rhizosphaerae]